MVGAIVFNGMLGRKPPSSRSGGILRTQHITKEMTMRHALIVGAVLFVFCSVAVFAQAPAAKNMVGTWKLDTAKSKYSPGPAPKSQVAVLEAADGGMKVVSDRVEADGK